MGGSAGTSSSTQNTSQKSKTAPWGPTVDPLKDIIGGVQGQFGNYQPTGAENDAIAQLLKNAQGGNPFTGQITGLANDLLSGGKDHSGLVNNAYADYKRQSQPYLSKDYLDPNTNPAFKSYMDTTTNDIQGRVNGMFAGAGRDMSGMNFQTLARGITEGTAPIFANQYNQNVATQRGVMDNLYNAGNTTAGALSGLNQLSLGNRSAGVGMAGEAMNAQNYGANATLQAEAMKRGLPLANLGQLSSLLLPIAGLGSQSKGNATSVGTQTMSPIQQFMGISSGIGNLGSGFNQGVTGWGKLLG
jgi:hypothetical protein